MYGYFVAYANIAAFFGVNKKKKKITLDIIYVMVLVFVQNDSEHGIIL